MQRLCDVANKPYLCRAEVLSNRSIYCVTWLPERMEFDDGYDVSLVRVAEIMKACGRVVEK